MRKELEATLGGDAELAASLQKLLTGRLPPPRPGLESTGEVARVLSNAAAADRGLEAIIERHGRPSLLIYNGMYEPALADVWAERLAAVVDSLRAAIAATGRVEVRGIGAAHLGTAWMIEGNIAVTNRHVAEIFTEARNGVFEIARDTNGQPFQVLVDFLAEADNTASKEVAVTGVLHIADESRDEPDLAFLQLADGFPPAPALGDDTTLNPQDFLATIGYPAWNTNNDAADMKRIFNNVFDVKQLAPGAVKQLRPVVFTHDCSTLNGSSGSIVVSLAQQAAVGLHFSGREGVENRTVRIGEVRRHLDRALGRGPVPSVVGATAIPDEQAEAVPVLDGRVGYVPDGFLGEGIRVPCPQPVDGPDAVLTPLTASPGEFELRFHHFSSFMHKARRLPMFTAVNIDGSSIDRIKRGRDRWFLDPRIPAEAQTGAELYTGNALDQGHLVRRLDPGWGDVGAAAIEDTFFYTNCAPQHSSLNRKTWLALEDYVLESAETHGFRACVFSGPVFGDKDPIYRDDHRLPQAFWKVVVTLKAAEAGGAQVLASSAYALSQADLVSGLEFTYGPFRTYQVPIGRVTRWSKLSFDSTITAADAFDTAQEAVGYRPIDGPGDLRI